MTVLGPFFPVRASSLFAQGETPILGMQFPLLLWGLDQHHSLETYKIFDLLAWVHCMYDLHIITPNQEELAHGAGIHWSSHLLYHLEAAGPMEH